MIVIGINQILMKASDYWIDMQIKIKEAYKNVDNMFALKTTYKHCQQGLRHETIYSKINRFNYWVSN